MNKGASKSLKWRFLDKTADGKRKRDLWLLLAPYKSIYGQKDKNVRKYTQSFSLG